MTSATDDRPVPVHARQLAAQLSALFDRDVEIVKQLNRAHDLLAHANDQLLCAGRVLNSPPQIHSQIHRAFSTYQTAAEQRRQLAVDVGEISQQLTEALCAAGYTTQQAREANVHQLAEPAPP